MKNPNGYGSVVKLSGNRRNPFCARKTAGWNEKGQPIYKAVGYYKTRQEAMIALAEYNRNPFDIDLSKITMIQLYEKWSERNFPKMATSSVNSMKTSINHCKPLWDTPYKKIKTYMMQEIIDNCGRGYSTQGAIKTLWGQLDKYAMEMDIITKMNSALVTAESIPETNKRPFTEEEIAMVWEAKYKPNADIILFLLYTGFRISELLSMETASINFDDIPYFKGGTKTKAGKDRIVPIHPLILDLVKSRVRSGEKYLISENGKKIPTVKFYSIWNALMEDIGIQHTPHECRHTFRSRLDSAGANKVCIDLMMGHKSKEVGERIYTHKTIEELLNALLLVTN